MSLKFSIVTPSLNQGRFIRDTVESVLNQSYENFEHIIVDGGSTDETINILKGYPHLKWISEKDSGPPNAINKGFKVATGDIFAWINSDDYYEKNIFCDINSIFANDKNCEFLYGNLTFIDEDTIRFFKDKTKRPTKEFFVHESADLLRQPCTFFKKELFMMFNGLDENIKVAFDYDFFIKMLEETNPYYIDKNLAYQRMSSTTFSKKNINRQAMEIFKISRKNGSSVFDPIMYRSIIKKILFPQKF